MPPHCDTMDGPVVMAAKQALERNNVNLILPWSPKNAEDEIKTAFEKVVAARKLGIKSKEIADYWFFETIVRLHRKGEGEPFTGLKPAGSDSGPIVSIAEKAIELGNANYLMVSLQHAMEEEIRKKFRIVMSSKDYEENNVDEARYHISAMLDFILYSHKLYSCIRHGANKHQH